MQMIDVTSRVWDRLLAVRAGRACICCGNWTEAEHAALALYGPLARRDLGPVAFGQIGQSLDGRIATVSGDARDVSGPDGLAHLHRMRALADAVVIGVRTALHDVPRLTVRLCSGDNPARVVIDPQGRLPDDAPVLKADGARRIIIQSTDRPRPAGVDVLRLPRLNGQVDARRILDALHREGLNSVLIEGGAITLSNFIDAGRLSRLQVAVAPLLIGGGPQGFHTRNPVAKLTDALRPQTRVFNIGSDILFDCGILPQAKRASMPQHPPTASMAETRHGH